MQAHARDLGGWKSGTSSGLLFRKGSDLRIGCQARVERAVRTSEAIAPELPRSASDNCQNLNVQHRRAGKAAS
jgi:hypothetical protein